MNTRDIISLFSAATIVNLLLASNAWAYLDPGTGSSILQGILAALAALVITAKLYWHRLLRFFGIGRNKSSQKVSSTTQKMTDDKAGDTEK